MSTRWACHRPRIADRDCFEAILLRLVTGCSWAVGGRFGGASDTTLRRRRDAWIAAGVFDALVAEALAGYDRPDPHSAAPTRLRLDAQSTPVNWGEKSNPPAPLPRPRSTSPQPRTNT